MYAAQSLLRAASLTLEGDRSLESPLPRPIKPLASPLQEKVLRLMRALTDTAQFLGGQVEVAGEVGEVGDVGEAEEAGEIGKVEEGEVGEVGR